MSNPISDFIKFLYNDFKEDIRFIIKVCKGEKKLTIDPEKLKELKDWKGILKENWLLFLIDLMKED